MTRPLTTTQRGLLSIALALHVTAVFVGPWSMRPYDSPLSATVGGWFEPYLRALSLDNGYRFFAPEPGPSHLIRYDLTLADGGKVSGQFPDLEVHWPRLFYHRHFMLTEFVNALDNPEFENPALDQTPLPDELLPVKGNRDMYREVIRSYARHLAKAHAATKVELTLRRHEIPSPNDVLEGTRLNDERLFREKPLGVFEGDDLK